jgi:hypothetical protein
VTVVASRMYCNYLSVAFCVVHDERWLTCVQEPSAQSFAAVAAITTCAHRYVSAIFEDSAAQSSSSSCTMHKESIQMYSKPSFRVTVIASCSVLGRLEVSSIS